MVESSRIDLFSEAARRVGSEVVVLDDLAAAAAYIVGKTSGPVLLPPSPVMESKDLAACLTRIGAEVVIEGFRQAAPAAAAGVTGADFALADTGTVVLESTEEAVRLSTTLPERHFVLLDPRRIVADGPAAVPLLRQLQQRRPRSFIAYITGPSRTADIERVLTIGVHGPRELHILLVEGISGGLPEL